MELHVLKREYLARPMEFGQHNLGNDYASKACRILQQDLSVINKPCVLYFYWFMLLLSRSLYWAWISWVVWSRPPKPMRLRKQRDMHALTHQTGVRQSTSQPQQQWQQNDYQQPRHVLTTCTTNYIIIFIWDPITNSSSINITPYSVSPYLNFSLISIINFYYVINKLIILYMT
jgi:hypothetical protein